MEKYERLNDNVQENEIAVCFDGLRAIMLLPYRNVAKITFATEEDMSKIITMDDSEISTDLLFKLYYIANEVLTYGIAKNGNEEAKDAEFAHTCAMRMFDAIRKELYRRNEF